MTLKGGGLREMNVSNLHDFFNLAKQDVLYMASKMAVKFQEHLL